MDISSIYNGVESSTTTTPNNSISIEYRTKDEHKSLPKGAKIKSQNRTTTIQQIENGYIIIKREEIYYEAKSENEESEHCNYPMSDWICNITQTFSKEKPTEIDLIY